MKPTRMLLAAVIPVLTFVGVGLAGAAPAAAEPGPTPNGLTGAANMVNEHAYPHMVHAMLVNNANGDAGMWCAVYITNGVVAPGHCP